MKKSLLLLLLLTSISFVGFSQYKGNPGKAKSLLDKSELKSDESEIRELLINAKGEIDAAILLTKQSEKANTWLIRGDVYSAIAKGYTDIDSDAIEKSIEAIEEADIIIALCLGAKFVFIGRAPLYGAAAGGLEGIKRTCDILKEEIDQNMGQIGCTDLDQLSKQWLHKNN